MLLLFDHVKGYSNKVINRTRFELDVLSELTDSLTNQSR